MLIEKDYTHTRIKDTRARPMNAVEKRHANRVAAMGCIICGAPAQYHHERGKPLRKRDHRYGLPLCPWDHTEGPEARHRTSYEQFAAIIGCDPMDKAIGLWLQSQEIENVR